MNDLKAQLHASQAEALGAHAALQQRATEQKAIDVPLEAPRDEAPPESPEDIPEVPDVEQLAEIDRLLVRVQHAEEATQAATVDRQGLHAEIRELREARALHPVLSSHALLPQAPKPNPFPNLRHSSGKGGTRPILCFLSLQPRPSLTGRTPGSQRGCCLWSISSDARQISPGGSWKPR